MKPYDPEKPGISLDLAVSEVRMAVQDAEDFISSELEPDWELAERYFRGETDIPTVENRSNVVKTEVRDAIRNTVPSIMRVLTSKRSLVDYIPSSVQNAPWVAQQGEYATQLFWENDGYTNLLAAVQESLKLKTGILKVWWEPSPNEVNVSYTKVPMTFVEELRKNPLFEIGDFEKVEDTSVAADKLSLYNVSGRTLRENGAIRMECVPNYEFFISRNVNSIEQALSRGVHGHRRVVTVTEARELGLEYDDFFSLSDEDPEDGDFSGSSMARRGYAVDDDSAAKTSDPSQHKFTLVEAYVRHDLEGTGRAQTYVFYLGGASYTYLHHELVSDSPFAVMQPIPIPHTVYGLSIADLVIKEQDTSTSMLRATVDNAHAVNNARIAADPNKTSFEDLVNPALNAPIRIRAGATIQAISVPSTAQGNLGVLSYLDQDVQNKVGVTKAAQGLDPDALQSTQKDAVMNTIQMSQGQTELMVRNIVETALIRVFRMLMRLTVQHAEPVRQMQIKGVYLPVNITMFDPDAKAMPNVGLGTADVQTKMSSLQFIYAEQQKYMQTLGPNNPFTSYAQIYNTLEDMLETAGIYDVQKYFNVVTPGVEKQWAEAMQKAAAAKQQQEAANQPLDPSKALREVELAKNETKRAEVQFDAAQKAQELRLRALSAQEQNDLKRDELVQRREIELAKLGEKIASDRAAAIREEQNANDIPSTTENSGAGAATEPAPTSGAGTPADATDAGNAVGQ